MVVVVVLVVVVVVVVVDDVDVCVYDKEFTKSCKLNLINFPVDQLSTKLQK